MILPVYIWTQLKICLASFARDTDTAKDPVTFSVRVDIDSARHIASVQHLSSDTFQNGQEG